MSARSKEADSRRIMIMGDGGVVSPIGNDIQTFYNSLITGQSGIDYLPEEMRTLGVVSGALVKGYKADEYLHPNYLQDLHPVVQYMNTAKIQALRSAGFLDDDLSLKDVEPHRIGIVVGTGVGGTFHIGHMENVLNEGRNLNRHDLLLTIPCRTALGLTMRQQDIQGPSLVINGACASGAIAVTVAADKIKLGQADVMITGGSEACVGRNMVAAFAVLGALSTKEPAWACRPFDRKGTGFVPGEGSGSLILESLEHVKKRNALHLVRAELLGYKHLSDGFCRDSLEDNVAMFGPVQGARYRRIADVAPTLIGAMNVMQGALDNAGLAAEEVNWLIAHTPGPVIGGIIEGTAFERKFGKHTPISAGKEYAGHQIAGDINRLNAVIMSLHTGIIWHILHLEEPVVDLAFVMDKARHCKPDSLRTALFNQFGFGGANVSLTVGLPENL